MPAEKPSRPYCCTWPITAEDSVLVCVTVIPGVIAAATSRMDNDLVTLLRNHQVSGAQSIFLNGQAVDTWVDEAIRLFPMTLVIPGLIQGTAIDMNDV